MSPYLNCLRQRCSKLALSRQQPPALDYHMATAMMNGYGQYYGYSGVNNLKELLFARKEDLAQTSNPPACSPALTPRIWAARAANGLCIAQHVGGELRAHDGQAGGRGLGSVAGRPPQLNGRCKHRAPSAHHSTLEIFNGNISQIHFICVLVLGTVHSRK